LNSLFDIVNKLFLVCNQWCWLSNVLQFSI
jgi:hypothetical protein